ncbi:MAG TPA: hypothetical protein VGM52_12280 [Herbaspirillum sp.]|jgi:hypothetical protein
MRNDLTGEELRWMHTVFKGEFRLIPRRIVQSILSKGLGVPNLGGAFNLTKEGRAVFNRHGDDNAHDDEFDMHIVKSKVKHKSNWAL